MIFEWSVIGAKSTCSNLSKTMPSPELHAFIKPREISVRAGDEYHAAGVPVGRYEHSKAVGNEWVYRNAIAIENERGRRR